ncbi:MAG: bifunctional metallophosphatase/5'-nucleotidase [Candidatus Hydrogenedens sp.]|jgi:sulfur-oxidizing protein SoxB|nr:bifunctional metallophosphatase/5'-nucleotidase [Candidatus Hydrogenedens sp.]
MPKYFLTLLFLFSLIISMASADTDTLLILHTNDIHGHIKADPHGQGGMPYVAAWVAGVRQERDDVLLFDGGDVMRKGDLVAEKTQHRIMYEAMNKIGYTAGAIGNHDDFHGFDVLHECADLSGMHLLCLNHLDDEGQPRFEPSAIVEKKGLKVGIIGLTTISGGAYKSVDSCGEQLRLEAEKLESEVDLTVAVVHIGSKECALLSALAPTVDVFVSGHTHEAIQEAIVVPETGALIVQAGQYAQNVGVLDLVVDKETKSVKSSQSRLVPMEPETVTPDAEMIAWIAAEEQKYCPDAMEVVGETDSIIQIPDLIRIASAALQWKSGADVAFCHSFVMRSNQQAGEITANSVFQAAGQRGDEVVWTELTGAQIHAYMDCLSGERRGKTAWHGFEGKMEKNGDGNVLTLVSDLEEEKIYQVALPLYQWEQHMKHCGEGVALLESLPKTMPVTGYSVADAMTEYLRAIRETGTSVEKLLAVLN